MRERRAWQVTCLMLAVVLAAVVPCSTAYADASDKRAVVIYGGNGSASDAEDVSRRLGNLGWTRSYHDSWNGGADHDKLSNYADDTFRADLIWYSGHGWRDGYIPIYNPSALNKYRRKVDAQGKADHVRYEKGSCYTFTYPTSLHGAEATDIWHVEVADWEVGASFTDSTRQYTDSRWDNNVEWAIITACSQLNNGQISGWKNFYGYTPAVGWARALCGTPGKAHSVCGYWGTGPGDGQDNTVADVFFDYQESRGPSIIYSWIRANESINRDTWASASHWSNQNDALWGQGTVYADDTGTNDIRYTYSSSGQPGDHDVQPLSIGRSDKRRDKGGPRKVRGRSRTISVTAVAERRVDSTSCPTYQVTEEASSVARALLCRLGARDAQPTDKRPGVVASREGTASLYADGTLLLDSHPMRQEVLFGDDAWARSIATSWLARNGVAQDVSFSGSHDVVVASLDPVTGKTSGAKTVGKVLDFRPTWTVTSGAQSEDGLGVKLIVDSAGVSWARVRLPRAQEVATRSSARITSQEALKMLADDRGANLPDEVSLTDVRLLPLLPEGARVGDVTTAAWAADVDGGTEYVSAR